jgi:hypothetical protein
MGIPEGIFGGELLPVHKTNGLAGHTTSIVFTRPTTGRTRLAFSILVNHQPYPGVGRIVSLGPPWLIVSCLNETAEEEGSNRSLTDTGPCQTHLPYSYLLLFISFISCRKKVHKYKKYSPLWILSEGKFSYL